MYLLKKYNEDNDSCVWLTVVLEYLDVFMDSSCKF